MAPHPRPLLRYMQACGDLFDDCDGDMAVPITDVVSDSRQVAAGSLFVAIRGEQLDGREFIADAVERGAAAVVHSGDPIPGLPVPSIRAVSSTGTM